MNRLLRSLCAPILLAGCSAVLIGCGGTFENRTIQFSSDGKNVAFQRGDGIYIANKDGKGLTKITPPDKEAIAVGMPEWAPNDQRLIFATARPVDNKHSTVTWPGLDDNPNGRFFLRQPARYTCWLRDEPKGDAPPQMHQLFTADVDDVGYIAAGLAVRWHPKGDRVLFVQEVGEGHAVFEFNLAGKTTRRVFPENNDAKAVVFDWTPDGANLVCVLADMKQPEKAGIWIGRDAADWWHVEQSAPLPGKPEMRLERLKAARPTWTKDGQRFAFVTPDSPKSEGAQSRRVLWLGQLDGHRASQIAEGYEPIRDLAWHPDGKKLGFIRGDDPGTLQIAQLDGTMMTVTKRPIRTFAGWDATGAHLAYTTADGKMPNQDKGQYSLLIMPDPLARDELWIAPGDGKSPGSAIVSGLRTTFTHWSPTEDKLSLWFTFAPTHRSVFSTFTGSGLRPGDPAAIIDAATGKINWMATDAHEKAQIGHYNLLKRNYAEVWTWYEQADRDLTPKARAPKEEASLTGRPFRDFSLFEYYCLKKLNRTDEANAKLTAYRKAVQDWLKAQEPKKDDKKNDKPEEENPLFAAALVGNFYAAEVFLSLDAARDGEEFLRQEMAEAKSDEERFYIAVVLSQVVLLEEHYDDYAALTTDVLAPLMRKTWKPNTDAAGKLSERLQKQPFGLGTLVVMPLARPDLLAKIPQEKLPRLVAAWKELHSKAPDDLFALGSGLILEELSKRNGQTKEAGELRSGLEKLLEKAELAKGLDGKSANEEMLKSLGR